MNDERVITKPSKYDRCDPLTKVHCTWLYPLFIRGLKRDIEIQDIYKCSEEDTAERLVKKFERNWNNELKKKCPSFTRASLKTFLPLMFTPFILILITVFITIFIILSSFTLLVFTFNYFIDRKESLIKFLSLNLFEECVMECSKAVFLGYVLRFFANPTKYSYFGACGYAAGVCASSILVISLIHPAMFLGHTVAMKARVCWCTLMYKKSLRLKHSAFKKTTIGQILNLMSNDVSRLDEFSQISSYLLVGPLNTIVGLYIVWQYIGWVCLIGLAVMMCFVPINSFMGRIFLKIRTKVAALSDNRIRLMNEIIKGMRVIKMYAWERHFSKLISDARKKEISQIRKSILLKAFNNCISMMTPKVVIFTIFVVHVTITGSLEAEPVFVTMTIFNNLRFTMSYCFQQSVALLAELYVSCKRIQKYLLLDEISDPLPSIESNGLDMNSDENDVKLKLLENESKQTVDSINDNQFCIIVDKMSASWDRQSVNPTLRNISVDLKKGELLAVIGPVGAGKSSFLMSLLHEIEVTSGRVSINGNIAYASQESWSFNSSILQNILFGKPYDPKRFKDVISVCAMKRDLKLFPFAEKTLVGERGVTLSGGQKARITLARALYNDADVYLLDDPLSAVDTEVAKHIFDKCIGEYLKAKTVVLVTHQIQFIQKANKILVLKEGEPLAFGSYEELMQRGIDLMSLIKEEHPENAKEDDLIDSREQFKNRTLSVLSTKSDDDIEVKEQKIDDETKAKGSISARVYWDYISAGAGPVFLVLVAVTTLISQSLFHFNDWWLSEWTNRDDARKGNTTQRSLADMTEEKKNIIIYSIIVSTFFISLLLRAGTWYSMCIIASNNLHNRIFYRLMRTPIAFFENNPVGRILNRFTKDIGIVDELLPGTSYDLNIIVMEIIGSIIIVALINMYLIIPATFLIIFVLVVRSAYLRTGRDLKRFEGMARSPIYNHMTVTLSGLATIRAFKAQQLFRNQYFRYQDDHTSTQFMCVSASRCLGVTMDWMCWMFVVCVALIIMIFHEGLPSGSAGLALTMALGLTGMTQWGVRQSAEMENQMTSVERIVEYSKLKTEAELESESPPPDDWPKKGCIELRNVYLTYDNTMKPTLNDLNCQIKGGEKVGIVGRTGAGKSSILAALFRMQEIVGDIVIDGINCKTIGLHELRRKMSIIPQDPIAFIGSLRKNLDPFDEHSEERLWEVLEEVQLRDAVIEMPGKLEYELSESGGNLSVGQRQLICLARAILRRNRILVLDEATANVDHKTDSLIQKTIRKNFADCTVLTIAHRLNTVIDSDRVLVMDAGRIVEFGQPYVLLQNNSGMFFKLVKQTGPQMSAELIRSAKQAFDEKNSKQNILDI